MVALHIGINNDQADAPAAKLDWLLGWMAGAWPRTRLIVIPPLPSKKHQYLAYRDAYARVVQRRPGVFLSLCGAGLNPADVTDLKDGVHPVASGFAKIFTCLRPQVDTALRRWQAGGAKRVA